MKEIVFILYDLYIYKVLHFTAITRILSVFIVKKMALIGSF